MTLALPISPSDQFNQAHFDRAFNRWAPDGSGAGLLSDEDLRQIAAGLSPEHAQRAYTQRSKAWQANPQQREAHEQILQGERDVEEAMRRNAESLEILARAAQPTLSRSAATTKERAATRQHHQRQWTDAWATFMRRADTESDDTIATFVHEFTAACKHLSLVAVLVPVVAFVRAMDSRNRERNDKIATLEATVEELKAAIATLRTTLEKQDAKVRALEARPAGVKYCGVWQEGLEYMRDDAVTKGGGIWICKADHVKTEPSIDHQGWQLAVQRGRDGRHAPGTR